MAPIISLIVHLLIIGNSAINFTDGEDILDLCAHITNKFNLNKENWIAYNILQQDISRVGALDIGFYNKIFSLLIKKFHLN